MLYDAWGLQRTATGSGHGKYRFTGADFDSGTGLYHMGARFYDPSLGRWLSEDSVQDKPFEPHTLNLYAYAFLTPTLLVDSDGKDPSRPGLGASELDTGAGAGFYAGMVEAARRAADAARAGGLSPREIGAAAARAVASLMGRSRVLGQEVYVRVAGYVRGRYVDILGYNSAKDAVVAIEVKAGRVGFSIDLVKQVYKDIVLLKSGIVDEITWIVARDSNPLFLDWLRKLGINVVVE
jgi:RHS repeat-associated protein